MILRIVFLFLFCFLSPPLLAASYGPYQLNEVSATDGDTVVAEIDIWFGLRVTSLIRISGIDTPELKGNGSRVIPPCEKVLAKNAMDFTIKWIGASKKIIASHIRKDKYFGRIEAQIADEKGGLLAGALLAAGHARPYAGGARQLWCQ